MSPRFTLRFVLPAGVPSHHDLAPAWPPPLTVQRRDDDGVLLIHHGETLLARVDRLRADDPRGKTTLAALSRQATTHGEGEALDAVRFILDQAETVIVAQPVLTDELSLERSLEPLDALWDLLFDRFGGLLQIDGEGLYGEEGLLIATE